MTARGGGGQTRAFAPGRVNLIGEHTDYNDGLCLPFAIRAGVTVTVQPGDDAIVHARAIDLGQEDIFEVRDPQPCDGWRAFVRGTVGELQRTGSAVRGGVLESVENDWVGARTGVLDQIAALFATPGHALRLDTRSLAISPVAPTRKFRKRRPFSLAHRRSEVPSA